MSDVWWGPSSWFEDECVLDVSLPGGKSAPISFSSYNGTNPIMGLHPHDLIKTQLPTKTPPQLGGSRFQHTNLEEGRQIAVHTSPIQDLNPHLGKACFIMTCWWCLSWGWEGRIEAGCHFLPSLTYTNKTTIFAENLDNPLRIMFGVHNAFPQ